MEKIKKLFATAATRKGSYSVGMTAMAIGAAVVFNLAAGQLPEGIRQVDISDNRIYEITDTSRELAAGLEEEVELKVLQSREEYDGRLVRFLEQYEGLSDKLSLEWIDPVLHPSALTEYKAEENSVVVSCEATGRTKTIGYYDMIVPDYYSYTEAEFDAEGQLTGAINYAAGAREYMVYYTSGHGEAELSEDVKELLGKLGASWEEVNLLMTGSVPEDCGLLLVNGPTSDLAAEEEAALEGYMKDGGKAMILLAASDSEQPNLEGFLGKYGMTVEKGYAADMQRNLQGNYYWIFPQIMAGENLTEGMDTGMVLLVNSRGMTLGEPERDTVSLQAVLETSSEGYMVTEESQEAGTYALGAVAVESVSGNEEAGEASEDGGEAQGDKESRLTVLASDSLINGELTSMYGSLENLTLFMNLVAANFPDVTNISIEAKSLAVTYNTMQHVGALGFGAVIGVPAVFLLGGFVQWRRRRKA